MENDTFVGMHYSLGEACDSADREAKVWEICCSNITMFLSVAVFIPVVKILIEINLLWLMFDLLLGARECICLALFSSILSSSFFVVHVLSLTHVCVFGCLGDATVFCLH